MKNKLNYLFLLLAAAFVLVVGCKKEDSMSTPPADKPATTNAPAVPDAPK